MVETLLSNGREVGFLANRNSTPLIIPKLPVQERKGVVFGRVEQESCEERGGQHEHVHRGAGYAGNGGKGVFAAVVTAYRSAQADFAHRILAPNITAKSIAIGRLWTNTAMRKPTAWIKPKIAMAMLTGILSPT